MNKLLLFIGAFSLLFTSAVAVPVVAAQQQSLPRACLTKDEESPPTGLPAAPPIIFDQPQIIHNQKSYYVEIFSDTAQEPGSRFDQCFRYEAENKGPAPIKDFYWELAHNLWVNPMKMGERHSRKMILPVDDEPRIITTRVSGFENDWANTKAWAPAERSTGTPAVSFKKFGMQSPLFKAVGPDSVIGLSSFLKRHGLPSRPLTAFYLRQADQKASTLQDSYSGQGIEISLRSDASRSGDKITIRTEIVARGADAAEAKYYLPALKALPKLEKTPNMEEYDIFYRHYRALLNKPFPFQKIWVFTSSMPASVFSNGAVYSMLHPIAIEHKGERVCFLATSYSPFLLSFSGQDCASR